MMHSMSEIAAHIGIPASMDILPASIPPIMPMNAMKQTAESETFSIITAALHVSAEMIAQIKEMIFSPMFILRGFVLVTTTVLLAF